MNTNNKICLFICVVSTILVINAFFQPDLGVNPNQMSMNELKADVQENFSELIGSPINENITEGSGGNLESSELPGISNSEFQFNSSLKGIDPSFFDEINENISIPEEDSENGYPDSKWITGPYPITKEYPKSSLTVEKIKGKDESGSLTDGTYNIAAVVAIPNQIKILVKPCDPSYNSLRVFRISVTLKWSTEQKSTTIGDCSFGDLIMWKYGDTKEEDGIAFNIGASTYVETVESDGKWYQIFCQTNSFEFSLKSACEGVSNDVRFYIQVTYPGTGGSLTLKNVQILYKIPNTVPSISNPIISGPNPAKVGDILSASATYSDIDSNTLNPVHTASLFYQWYQGSTVISNAQTSTYQIPQGAVPGSTYSCQMVAIDSEFESSASSMTTSIGLVNQNPCINSFTVTGYATIDSVRMINASGILSTQIEPLVSVDSDGHPLTYSYQWRRSNTKTGTVNDISGATGSTYAPKVDDIGYIVYCSITVSDPYGGSAGATTENVMVANRKPIIQNVVLPINNTGYFSDSISVSATISDPDGVIPTVDVRWYQWVNGKGVYFASTQYDFSSKKLSISNLRQYFTQREVQIYAYIEGKDNHALVPENHYITTNLITVSNRLPLVKANPNLVWQNTSLPYAAGCINLNLSLSTQFQDLDGDILQMKKITWWRIPAGITTAQIIYNHTGLSLEGSAGIIKGDQIYASIEITDGYDNITVRTSNLQVQTFPTELTITNLVHDNPIDGVYVNSNLTLEYLIVDYNREQISITMELYARNAVGQTRLILQNNDNALQNLTQTNECFMKKIALENLEVIKGESIYFSLKWVSQMVTTSAMKIYNSLPEIKNITLTHVKDTIESYTEAGDVDNDSLCFEYMWLRNGSIYQTGTPTIGLPQMDTDMVYRLKMRAFDGTEFSLWKDSEPIFVPRFIEVLPPIIPEDNTTIDDSNNTTNTTSDSTTNTTTSIPPVTTTTTQNSGTNEAQSGTSPTDSNDYTTKPDSSDRTTSSSTTSENSTESDGLFGGIQDFLAGPGSFVQSIIGGDQGWLFVVVTIGTLIVLKFKKREVML
jgi:hypothetical protein